MDICLKRTPFFFVFITNSLKNRRIDLKSEKPQRNLNIQC
jgi:hypothetical protein